MYPNAPTLFAFTIIFAVAAISTVGFSVVWGIFAVTLFVTTAVAIHRSIPRAEEQKPRILSAISVAGSSVRTMPF